MARAAAIQTGFNNGEISPYMYGRVDTEKYPLSLRECTNMRVVTQGPSTKRDGTRFVAPVADESKPSRLFEFEFNPTQGYAIEMNDTKARFLTNRGLVTEASKAVTGITQANPAVVTAASHGYANGDQVLFPTVGPYSVLFNQVFTVAGATTNTFQLSGYNGTGLPAFSGSPTVARIYAIPAPYAAADLPTVTDLHAADVLNLFHGKYQPQKLTRSGATNWAFVPMVLKDGPYLTEDPQGITLTPSDRASLTPIMTSNTTPSGTVTGFGGDVGAYTVFNGNVGDRENVALAGSNVCYQLASGTKIIDAYYVVAMSDTSTLDRMPNNWKIQGSNDGSTWVTLDSRQGETGWGGGERRYYSFVNTEAFAYHQMIWTSTNGASGNSGFSELGIHVAAQSQTPFALTASGTTSINGGAGFLSTDVGRTIRLMGSDGRWRWATITSVDSTTQVNITLNGHALPDTSPIVRWRLGLFSDTTGWPTCGAYYQDRLALSGPPSNPNFVCFSLSGVYDTFTPSEDDGTVVASSGFAYQLIETQVTQINWFQPMYKGLIISTSEGEAIVQPMVSSFTTPTPFSALNFKTVWPTNYGSAPGLRPKQVDTATLFVDRRNKRVREMTYELQSDSFVAPNMNAMADHITQNGGIQRIAWMRHPDRVYWGVRADGVLLGFSYEREQSVNAWHKHYIAGFDGANGVVEDCAVISSPDGMNEDLWLTVKRGSRRYIEYIGDWFWHDTAQADACFVDASVKYTGSPVASVGGLAHLEGQTVRILADGMQPADQVVTNGTVTLPNGMTASTITIGLPFKARLWTLRPNAGAQNGTSQGKKKKIYKYILRLYRSLGGVIGDSQGRLDQLPYWKVANSFMQPLGLFSDDIGPAAFPGGWELDGGTVFENDSAYPFTVIAYMPQLVTEDA
jgi:hypothetical protein